MESGAGAAGDRDEQGRNDEVLEVCFFAAECLERGKREVDSAAEAGDQNADNGEDHHAVEQVGAEVVTRLEEYPDRDEGCDRDVSADEYDPEGTACSKTELQSEEQESKDADDTDYRSRNDSEAGAVCEETVYYSQDYEEHGYNCGRLISGRLCYDACAVRHEGSGDDVYEGRNDEHENEQSEDQEQLMGSLTHGVADNIADGFAAMTYRGEECAPVMKAADENATQDTPQENGDPAVDGSLYRAVDRACACDGGEVVPHKYRGLGSDIVDAISHGDCRGLS